MKISHVLSLSSPTTLLTTARLSGKAGSSGMPPDDESSDDDPIDVPEVVASLVLESVTEADAEIGDVDSDASELENVAVEVDAGVEVDVSPVPSSSGWCRRRS